MLLDHGVGGVSYHTIIRRISVVGAWMGAWAGGI